MQRSLTHTVFSASFVLLFTVSLLAAAPERSKGISMHMLPKRVADLSASKWGLTVSKSEYLTPDAGSLTLQTPVEFLAFVSKQNGPVKENGVWIVTTDPEAYSKSEQSLLEGVVAVCKREKIPLFICRGSQLPNGWKRFDQSN